MTFDKSKNIIIMKDQSDIPRYHAVKEIVEFYEKRYVKGMSWWKRIFGSRPDSYRYSYRIRFKTDCLDIVVGNELMFNTGHRMWVSATDGGEIMMYRSAERLRLDRTEFTKFIIVQTAYRETKRS